MHARQRRGQPEVVPLSRASTGVDGVRQRLEADHPLVIAFGADTSEGHLPINPDRPRRMTYCGIEDDRPDATCIPQPASMVPHLRVCPECAKRLRMRRRGQWSPTGGGRSQ